MYTLRVNMISILYEQKKFFINPYLSQISGAVRVSPHRQQTQRSNPPNLTRGKSFVTRTFPTFSTPSAQQIMRANNLIDLWCRNSFSIYLKTYMFPASLHYRNMFMFLSIVQLRMIFFPFCSLEMLDPDW